MKAPSFSFYVKDWLTSDTVATLHRTRKRFVGAYLYLICNAWEQDEPGTLPNDREILAEFARLTADEFDEMWPLVNKHFTVGPDNRLHNVKLRDIRKVQIRNRLNALGENSGKFQKRPAGRVAGRIDGRPAGRVVAKEKAEEKVKE